ncbi:MAG: BolA family protein [Rhodospirillales bacterium]|jgi:BolA protein|nr:BolA family protein [Rhodospirillales bacterium]|tara:strand:+ start:186 stop:464 length:279 start_codon:yes stop_codon:yes gene_type:complete
MSMAAVIEKKLNAALSPARLAIVDESLHHAGHAGARPEGESHFRVEVVSAAFANKPRVERQRMVYAILAEELSSGIHALALKTLTPDEDGTA